MLPSVPMSLFNPISLAQLYQKASKERVRIPVGKGQCSSRGPPASERIHEGGRAAGASVRAAAPSYLEHVSCEAWSLLSLTASWFSHRWRQEWA